MTYHEHKAALELPLEEYLKLRFEDSKEQRKLLGDTDQTRPFLELLWEKTWWKHQAQKKSP